MRNPCHDWDTDALNVAVLRTRPHLCGYYETQKHTQNKSMRTGTTLSNTTLLVVFSTVSRYSRGRYPTSQTLPLPHLEARTIILAQTHPLQRVQHHYLRLLLPPPTLGQPLCGLTAQLVPGGGSRCSGHPSCIVLSRRAMRKRIAEPGVQVIFHQLLLGGEA